MNWPNIISTLGLLLDCIGVIILFWGDSIETGTTFEEDIQVDNSRMRPKARKARTFGLTFLLLGFSLQAVANWL